MKDDVRPILLVEDNPMDVDLALRAFRRRKAANDIPVARDGEEAIDLLEEWKNGKTLPIVILLDINLPKISGLEVLKTYKANPITQRIPVVMLTTSKEDKDVAEAYQLGANSYIVKPVDFSKFMEIAEQIELYWAVLNFTG
ncbi:chemotaxis protein CheY [Ornatilinea apprima]|uniref:Chemotaxis protein CheY n=1 Tax=Ornatilinea apprima TaxID=1134406 RepID=A0A0P6X6F5_9CHLR|nr:response regulator [Ornatilinea apprima]KPL78646.1 chemotaxis protein CheY [Ornatilinea apprima]